MPPKSTSTCVMCGQPFVPAENRKGDRAIRYCSTQCRRATSGHGKAERVARELGFADAESAIRQIYTRDLRSVQDAADKLGVGRLTVQAIMRSHNIRQRTTAEQRAIDLREMDYETRLQMTANSRAIITGRRRSHEDLCRRAQGKQRTAVLSDDEAEIMAAFYEAGLHPIPLYAIDKFNVDFAFPEVKLAVEYHGGNWHNTRKKRESDAAKARHLAANGWTLLVFPRLYRPISYKIKGGNKSVKLPALVAKVQRTLTHLTPPAGE